MHAHRAKIQSALSIFTHSHWQTASASDTPTITTVLSRQTTVSVSHYSTAIICPPPLLSELLLDKEEANSPLN